MTELSAPAPQHAHVPTASGAPEAVWFDTKGRLPHPSQLVQILTPQGTRHVARFEVAFTERWPSGASWLLQRTGRALPFGAVAVWTPDVEAAPGETLEAPGMPAASVPIDVPAPESVEPPAIAAEIVTELVRTGEMLQRIPQAHLDWTPHPHLPSLRTLALRLVRIAARVGWVLELDAIEQTYEPDVSDLKTVDQMVAAYLANQHAVRRIVAETTPGRLREPWTLQRHGTAVVQLPRGNALRLFGLVPLVHHRAEMAMMLTALGVATEHPYGPWAFEETSAPSPWTPALAVG